MDNELKNLLINIQNSVIGLSNRIDKLDGRMDKFETQIDDLHNEVKEVKLTIDNEISKKIDVLYDGRIDEIRHRDEFIETVKKVENHEMRIHNLEKAVS